MANGINFYLKLDSRVPEEEKLRPLSKRLSPGDVTSLPFLGISWSRADYAVRNGYGQAASALVARNNSVKTDSL